MTKKYNVAVIGATGNVGREVLNSLSDRNFPINKMFAVASANSVGKPVSFGEETIKTYQIGDIDFAQVDFAFFCAGSKISKEYAKKAADKGCTVIDKSSLFRLDNDVPLIVPEANIAALKGFKAGGIIANPNCCTIPLAVALKPLDNVAKIKRVVISTYQSVSGAGKDAMEELYRQTKSKYVFEDLKPEVFPTQIAFNLFPHIGEFGEDGSTDEEYKIEHELKKIIGKHVKVSVTCVRVPVFVSHSMSVNVEFEKEMDAREAEEILSELDEIVVYSHDNEIQYATPVDVVENDEVYVSRIRNDASCKNTLNMWIVTDNLRKGAALNAVQIAEELLR
jgi:aspartate-semialdehyde dehydrogenase